MEHPHPHTVRQQFDPQASAYLHSAVHAAGPDLAHVADALLPTLAPGAAALDAGCGAGHLAFILAAAGLSVTALDPSPAMLDAVRQGAAARALTTIATCQAQVEALPFAEASFDLVATRYSAHHWRDLPAGLAALRRVLRPGGHLLVIDTLGDDDALVDTHLQAIELLRDRSHVRNRNRAEWLALLAQAGFEPPACFSWPLRLAFASWIERMRTPPARVAMIRALQDEAPAEVATALALEADGSFTLRTGCFWARG